MTRADSPYNCLSNDIFGIAVSSELPKILLIEQVSHIVDIYGTYGINLP